jgi:hypothetical protein
LTDAASLQQPAGITADRAKLNAQTPNSALSHTEKRPIGNPAENFTGNWTSSPGTYTAAAGYLIAAVNARHASVVNLSTGPLRSAVSRTSTASVVATSMHSPPLEPE